MKIRCFCLLLICSVLALSLNAAPIILGNASSYSVLAYSTVTNTGPTVVWGDLGVSPNMAVTGFPPGLVNGEIHQGDAHSLAARNDAITAYNTLAGYLPVTQNLTDQDLGGLLLTPGVYKSDTSAQLTGTLTLDFLDDPDALFIFQIGTTLTTASNSSVAIVNGDDCCNVYWQIGSSATLGTGTDFRGNILALASITLDSGASITEGRAIALNGAVTLDNNYITNVICETPDGEPIGEVPEPGSLLLLASGLFGIAVLGRKFRRRAA
jgi:type VI secretion system secreted protein VgrG